MTGLIEAYLAGTMSAEERDRFEAQLAKDEGLRQEVKLQQLTLAALQHHGRREDNQFAEAIQGLTHDELQNLLKQQREKYVDVAACAAEPAAEPEVRGTKHLVTTIIIMLVAIAAMAWWYMHR